VPSGSRCGESYDYCVVEDLRSLLWIANLGAIELHPLLVHADRLEAPTGVVFDLDPGPPAGIAACRKVALRLREVLASLDLRSVVKTSGWAGMHLVVPLNTPTTFEDAKRFARRLATHLAARHPGLVTHRPARALRRGRVFVDWSQNSRTRSIVAPYSLRAAAVPLVSAPLRWEEVGRGRRWFFGPQEVIERTSDGDPFRGALDLEQRLPPEDVLTSLLGEQAPEPEPGI
jgi:bifunctional non-homologous end joining protein LigD